MSKPDCVLSDNKKVRYLPRHDAESLETLLAVTMTEQHTENLAVCQSSLKQEVGVSSLQLKRGRLGSFHALRVTGNVYWDLPF